MTKKLTTEEWKVRAIAEHGDRYDYSNSIYKTSRLPISILCKTHGIFHQRAASHLRGKGCPDCAKIKKSTSQFIKEAIVVHGDKYDYSKVEYKHSKEPVIIFCRYHNKEFKQTPNAHLRGSGCYECSRKLHTKDSIQERLDIVGKGIKIIGAFKTTDHTSTFTCEKGHVWHSIVNSMIKKNNPSGCYECSGMLPLSKEIVQSRLDDKNTGITIIGEFKTVAHKTAFQCEKGHVWEAFVSNVISEKHPTSCPDCATSGFKANVPSLLYYLKIKQPFNTNEYLYKIGITNNSVDSRYIGGDIGIITVLRTWKFNTGASARVAEKLILDKFNEFQYKGENVLRRGGNTELLTKDVLNLDIKKEL